MNNVFFERHTSNLFSNKHIFQIARILAHVKRSQNRMVSFSRQDVIFLLNKWDSLLKKDDKDGFYEKTKFHFRDLWADVDDKCILKMSMNTVCISSVLFCFFTLFIIHWLFIFSN